MLKDSDFKKYLKTGKISENKYKNGLPKTAKSYISDNKDKIKRLKVKPYWYTQNKELLK